MKSTDSDKFVAKKSNNIPPENFFLSEDMHSYNDFNSSNLESMRRLNDYDLNILEEDAYKDIDDELFKLEYKIAKIEDAINIVDNQILAAEEINDCDYIEYLNQRKKVLEVNYGVLLKNYKEKGFSSKLTGSFSKFARNNKISIFKRIREYNDRFYKFLLKNLPSNLLSLLELKHKMAKLESLNRSVDELVSMNIPYGETYNKYDQLSKYIIKANAIQAEIIKQVKK